MDATYLAWEHFFESMTTLMNFEDKPPKVEHEL